MNLCLGIDTSNYTTSVALFDGARGINHGRLLDVPEGAIGLRQSGALFQHVRRLPELFEQLRELPNKDHIAAVGASTRPRAVEGSYMPCFLAGESLGRTLAQVLDVPFVPVSHQQGHLAAAAWSAGDLTLLDAPLLAWHLSGGTTELLLVIPEGRNIRAERIGGTDDLSAGQLVDRTGRLLGLAFPAGKALDELAGQSEQTDCFSVRLNGLSFSLSGVENKVKERAARGDPPQNTARFVLNTLADIIRRATAAAQCKYPNLPVLCAGGVASNRQIRAVLEKNCGAKFALPEHSADNALGVAILTRRLIETESGTGGN